MLLLYRQVGELQPDQLDFLVENLEEEWSEDRDYYVSRDMLQLLKDRGADASLVQMLEDALGSRNEA